MKHLFLNTVTKRCIIGIFQGTILYFLFTVSQNKIQWPASEPFIFLPMLMVTVFVPLLIIQGIASIRFKTIIIANLLIALTIVGIADYAIYRQVLTNHNQVSLVSIVFLPKLFFLTSIALFITQALTLSGEQERRFIATYPTYFNIAWKLGVQVLFTLAFVGFFWILLFLGSALFNLIHLTFFQNIITNTYFIFTATTLILAIALHITDINVRVIHGIRALCLTLLSWFLPLVAVIASLFLLSLFFTGLAPLWQTGHAGALLLLAAVILILLINAVYREGIYEQSLFSRQYWAAILSCYLLVPLIGLAIYALYLRIQQYGLSVERIYAVACMVIGTSYAISYALAAMLPKKRFILFTYGNIATAFLILIILLALNTPLVDPARLFVANQLFRLQSGKVTPEKFDFAALQSKGLRFGQQALQKLQTTTGQGTQYLQAKAKETTTSLIVHTSKGKLPSSFLSQHWSSMDGSITIPFCLRGMGKCDAWQVEDLQKNSLIIVLENSTFTGFKKNRSNQWTAIGHWLIPYQCSEQIRKAAIAGKFKLVSPPITNQDIEIMGRRMSFTQKIEKFNCS
ncbi:DUF4153 domain-containing protein [Legionella sp. D16C41]|uniref:DUF4153 domain-containing protein n=1 Tax=Legionella sp. D16C41 TaxID=3402688 RepID=UPI003AF99A1C